jgi:hypothetical protein
MTFIFAGFGYLADLLYSLKPLRQQMTVAGIGNALLFFYERSAEA